MIILSLLCVGVDETESVFRKEEKQPPCGKCSVEKDATKKFANYAEKHFCWTLFLIKLRTLITPETLFKKYATQVFSCEICGIFKNTYFDEHIRVTASKKDKFWYL